MNFFFRYMRCCLCLLIPYLAQSQSISNLPQSKADSLYERLSVFPDTITFDSLLEEARALIWTDKQRTRSYLDRAVVQAADWQDDRRWIKANRLLANLHMTSGNYDSALIVNQVAINKVRQMPAASDLAIVLYLNRGVFYQSANEYDRALEQYVAAYELSDSTGITTYQGKILNNLGVIYRRIDRKEAARLTYEKALELKTATGDSLGMANTLNNLGIVQMELKEEEQSILTFQRAKRIYIELGEMGEARSVDLSLGQAYFYSGEQDLALSTWELALQEPGLKSDVRTLAYTFLGLSEINRKKGNYRDAKEYLEYAEEYAASLQIPRMHADLTRLRAELYQQEGVSDSAVSYFASYVEQMDVVIEDERQEQQQLLAEKFESKLKAAEIERQQLVIQQQEQQEVLLWLGLGVLALLAIGIYLVYFFRLSYQRSEAKRIREMRDNEVRELKKENEVNNLRAMIAGEEAERQRVAKDLHDGLGGLLATVKARFSDQSADDQDGDNLLDRACAEVRRIAHNMAPQTLSLAGLSGALEDICAQLNLKGLNCELEISGEPDDKLDESGQVMLVRIVQELTHNVVKHAKADQLFIQLLAQSNQLLLTVEDNGIGFDAPKKRQLKSGLGLASIDSRAIFLNGILLFDSSPDHGTTVTLSIPL